MPALVVFLAVGVAFGLLLYRRRLGFRIAIFLAALALLYEVLGGVSSEELSAGGFVAFAIGIRIFSLLYLLALWAVAESLLRDTVPGFTTSLDSFVARRLGPRGGVAILSGLGAGAATIGITLLAFSAAALAAGRGAWPTGPSFAYPLFQTQKGPFFEGTFDAAIFVLFVALLRFVLPRLWAGTLGRDPLRAVPLFRDAPPPVGRGPRPVPSRTRSSSGACSTRTASRPSSSRRSRRRS